MFTSPPTEVKCTQNVSFYLVQHHVGSAEDVPEGLRNI